MKRKRNKKPEYHIFLLCRNNETNLRQSLPVILKECKKENITALVTESEDKTKDMLLSNGIRTADIRKEEFGHGRTRNLSLKYSDADIFVFLNGDAVPLTGWLGALIAGIRNCDAAFSRQIPDESCDPLRITDLVNHHFFRLTRKTVISRENGLPVAFDTVSCAIRRERLAALPFPDVPFGEDYLWAERLVRENGRIAYVPESVVIHSHSIYRSAVLLIRRHFEEGRLKSHHRDKFGLKYTLTFLPSAFLLDSITLTAIDIPLRERILWFIREPLLRSLQLMSFIAGLNEEKIPDILKNRLLWIK